MYIHIHLLITMSLQTSSFINRQNKLKSMKKKTKLLS